MQPRPPRRVKVQTVGPLTLGVALVGAGLDAKLAFPLAAHVARAWARALEDLVAAALPDTSVLCFFDEPALVCWRDSDGPIDREVATDLLSTALAAATTSGVHVCGTGDLRLALDAGPHVVHFDVAALDLDDAVSLSRFLDGDGWVAWGAIPTHRPVGEQPSAAVEGAARGVVRADAPRVRRRAAPQPGARLARMRSRRSR